MRGSKLSLGAAVALVVFAFLSVVEGANFFRRPHFSVWGGKQHKKTSYSGLVLPPDDIQYSHNTTVIPEWKKDLPFPLNNKTRTFQRIVFPGPDGVVCECYLLGTAHVSSDSCQEVRLLLEAVNPGTIFIEMCDQRTPLLLSTSSRSQSNENTTSETSSAAMTSPEEDSSKSKEPSPSLWERIKQNNATSLYGTAATLLTSMQEDYADSLGVELGGEFRVAYEFWDRERKTSRRHLILGDRPLYLTLTRSWESLSIFGKIKLLIGLLISSFQKPKPEELKEWMQKILQDDSEDLLSKSIEELSGHFPTIYDVIIRERDAYMACKLFQTCQQLNAMMQQSSITTGIKTHKVVAIVGAGHVDGMCRWLTVGNGQDQRPEEILSMLIRTKKPIPEEEAQFLMDSVSELNPELLAENHGVTI